MFGQHSAESAVCCLGVRYVCSRGGFIIGRGELCYQFHGSTYLLMAVSIVLEDGDEKFYFLGEGVLFITEVKSVYCIVRSGSGKNLHFVFKGLNTLLQLVKCGC